jgi:hypothetical protein
MDIEKVICMLKEKYNVNTTKSNNENPYYDSIIHSEYKKFIFKLYIDVIFLNIMIDRSDIEKLLKCVEKDASKPSSYIVITETKYAVDKEESFYFNGKCFVHFMFKNDNGWAYDENFHYSGAKEVKEIMSFISMNL